MNIFRWLFGCGGRPETSAYHSTPESRAEYRAQKYIREHEVRDKADQKVVNDYFRRLEGVGDET